MSKNLTFKDTVNGVDGIFIRVDIPDDTSYVWMCEPGEIINDIKLGKPRYYLLGPAIDRLYEFEQLGMEPEEIEKLKYERDIIEAALNSIKKDTKELFDTISSLKAMNADLMKTIDELEVQNSVLRHDYGIEADARMILEKENNKLKEELKQKTLFITATSNPYFNDEFNTRRSVWAKHIVDNNDKLKIENDKLKTKLKKATNHIASLKDQIKEFEYSESVEIRDLKTMNADLMKINDEAYKQIGLLTEEVEKWKKDAAKSHRLYSEQWDKTRSLTISNNELREEVEILTAENEKLRNELAHTEAKLNKCVSNKEFNDTTYRTALKCEIEGRKKLEAENKNLKAKMGTINLLSDLDQPFPITVDRKTLNKLWP